MVKKGDRWKEFSTAENGRRLFVQLFVFIVVLGLASWILIFVAPEFWR